MSTSTLKKVFRPAALIAAAVALLAANSFAALPELRINTENNKAITSTQVTKTFGAGNCTNTNIYVHKYTAASSITLTDNGKSVLSVAGKGDSIRGRGNSTYSSSITKKPYRIKFAEHQALTGGKKHKSWALLANWYDPTFALNAVAFELGRRLGLPGTPGYTFVDLYINDSYKGIYQIIRAGWRSTKKRVGSPRWTITARAPRTSRISSPNIRTILRRPSCIRS